MPRYNGICEQCGAEFNLYRGPNAKPPRFCSYRCYWASGDPGKNNRKGERKSGYRHVYMGRIDGKPKYILASHFVWDMTHPDDPVQPGDYVHHIDHNTLNDAPVNLRKMSVEQHQAYHAYLIPKNEASRRMKAYHAANPGRQRKGQTKICPVCGKEFYQPPSAPGVTCSYECSGKWSWMKKRGQT